MKCSVCKGRGWNYVSIGDDLYKDPCMECNGTGEEIGDAIGDTNGKGVQ